MPVKFTFVPQARSDSGISALKDDAVALGKLAARAGLQGVVLPNFAGFGRRAAFPEAPERLVLSHAATGSPVAAARRLSDLRRSSGGRLELDVNPGETGEGHIDSWHRIDEYLTLLKRLWSSERPFDYEGPFYSIRGGFVRDGADGPVNIPLRMRGLSGTALKVAARHADLIEIAAADLDEARLLMERVRAAATQHGRSRKIRFALPIAVSDGHPLPGEALVVDTSAQSALLLLAYIEAGISEFTVRVSTERSLMLFGATVATLVRNSALRRDAVAQPLAPVRQRDWAGGVRRWQ
ncbi:MAG: LLM class flavin-dependent oxidoreductase [Rhizobiaceae bacterium]|nr:LLM class flavin-dependent oxidoreductase [Rhizobiaceae bacterium]